MFDINGNASQSLSAITRHEHGALWQRKGFFWAFFAVGGMLPVAIVCPVLQFAVDDDFWSAAIVAIQFTLLAGQLAALVRMCVCYGRAHRIWRGAR